MRHYRSIVLVVALVGACTEPNPFAGSGTSEGSGGNTDTTTATTMSTSSDPTTTMSTTMSTTQSDTTAGTDDPTDVTGDPTGDPTGESTAGPVCAAGTHVCVPPPPRGWDGPSGVVLGAAADPEPTCAGDYPELAVSAFSDLQATAANCDCECQASANAACSMVSISRYANADSDCSDALATWSTGTACVASPANPNMQVAANVYWHAEAAITSGTCTPSPTEEIGPAEFDTRVTLCTAAPGPADGCEAAEQCLPIPDGDLDGRICVWQAGDLECPATDWTERTLLHQDIADDRDCTACTCGSAAGSCTGTLFLFNQANCGGGLLVNVPVNDNSCTLGASQLSVLGFDVNGALTPQNPTCPPSSSDPIGDAEAIAPVTVCCLP